MLLWILKNGVTWHYNAAMFRRKTLAFEEIMVGVLSLCKDVLQIKFMDI